MTEPIDDAPAPSDEVEAILDDEATDDAAARSLPQAGSDDDPGSEMNF